ncbi:MAG: zinc-ribbon domain-containing protein [Clostridia bacterium]|nr:zinc-ribbon domain-containing protein [Clostridia bacterium]
MYNNLKEPKHLKVLRSLGFILICTGILLIILGVVVFREDFAGTTIPNIALMVPGMFITVFSIPCLFMGFSAKISEMQIEQTRYIQEKNKDTLTDIADNVTDISEDAIIKVSHAVKEGFDDYVFCKHCGSKIDADSKFCKKCGREQ